MAPALHAGLDDRTAAARLAADGPNALPREDRRSAAGLLLRQLQGPLFWLLVGAAALSAAVGHAADSAAIGAVLALNAAVGFLQEFRAERALAALRGLGAPRARVRRGGAVRDVDAETLVAGDIVLLEAGDVVPADARLVEAHALRVVEAGLTGESVPVEKEVGGTGDGAPLAERRGHVFLGTAVAAGRAVAEVDATGARTEMGRIAGLLAAAEAGETPLQAQLRGVGRSLMVACLAVVALVTALDLLRGRPFVDVLLSSAALAVAAVPEGLPTIVTIALALGVQRMAARHALVRRLASVETLGSVTVVCTDKTGTLTTGAMALRETRADDPRAALLAAASCCDATLSAGGAAGDPTETAILRAAAEAGLAPEGVERANPRVSERPFDTARRLMSVLRADGRLYVKGAPESVMALCDGAPPDALQEAQRMAARGLRVLAVAVGAGAEERGLRFGGLLGLADPPRAEARAAIAAARRAGVRTLMVTGDHAATAHAIAREVGLVPEGHDGAGLVHARATAEDKLALVRALKAKGEVVAMTGDGVNDAPALREAHIGVAMGRGGTQVTREAADLVLTDDNFATIVAAVEEGRVVYDNIRKALLYLVTGNAAELAVMLGASLAGLPLPLLPLHLLWVNLATDGLPALALVAEPPAADALRRPPRPVGQPMLPARSWAGAAAVAALEAAVTLAVFASAAARLPLDAARTLAFGTLVFSELLRVLAARSPDALYWQVGAFTNLYVLAVVAVSALVQLALPYLPVTARWFGLVPPSAADLATAVAAALVPVSALELAKLVRRRSS